MTELLLRKNVVLIMMVIAMLVIIFGVVIRTENPLRKGIINSVDYIVNFFTGDTNKTVVSDEGDLPFYNEFVKNYQTCKLSPSSDCFCPITYPQIPENYVLEIQNFPNSKQTQIMLYVNAQLDDCRTLLLPSGEENIKTLQFSVANDLLYFENVYTSPSVVYEESPDEDLDIDIDEQEINQQTGKLQISDFIPISDPDRLYVSGSTLCSTKDVKGSNDIEIGSGIIYKFDNQKTAVLEGVSGLRRCDLLDNIVEAYEEFTRLLSTINNCKLSTCVYVVKDQQRNTLIPVDFSLVIQGKKLTLRHKEQEIISVDIKNNLCQFTDFRPTVRQETQLTTINVNDFYQIEVYPFPDKTCLLPYDERILQEKALVQERARLGLQPLVPTT